MRKFLKIKLLYMEKTDNSQVKSKREMLTERMRGKYPDKDFSDEESFYGQISDDYDDYDKRLSGYQEREKAFSDLFASDPRSANFLMNWKNGEHPMTALVRQFGKDGLEELVNNDEKMEEFAKANEEYLERVAKENELEQEYQTNLEASLKSIEEKQAAEGLSDEQVDAAMDFLIGIVRDGLMGKFTPESIDMAFKAINHDADVTNAAEEAEVRGKNAKVEATLRKKSKGDGTANLDGKNGNGGVQPRKGRSLGALEKFGSENRTIWERGNEKREKYH